MRYVISYYSEAVTDDVMSLPTTLLARYFSLSDRLEVHGPNLGEPHTKALKDGLYELRLKGAEGIGRVFYCTLVGKRIVVLHSFVKKSQKIPARELALARSRLREVKHGD